MFIIVFIDDIFIYSQSKNLYADHLRIVLQILKDNQLSNKFSKCKFCLRSIALLSDMVFAEGMQLDPQKIKTIKN